MLVLFETPAGFALFKVLDEGKLSNVENLGKEFLTAESARKVVKLKGFEKFVNTAAALSAATSLIDSKPSKGLRKFLRRHCDGETLGVADSKLGNAIKEKLKIDCIHNNAVMELMRGIRSQLSELISGLAAQDLAPMSLGLSHSLSRYKLKFSPDKVDTMIIQAIGLLDDIDKELNIYAMRVREWYGWHFPELAKIVKDNILYAKTVKLMGDRSNAVDLDFSEILPEEIETELKEAAKISMGTEVSDLDHMNIRELCSQVLSFAEYRVQLFDYLKSRMNSIAPNLTTLVGELVGARLIAHGGSLLNLAKQPGSTVQILGAEKALFRALKTKHSTPKYGLIYHASLIGQAAPKHKGKISRSLAAKAALAIRYDALGDSSDSTMGLENRAKLEARLRFLEGKELGRSAGSAAKGKAKIEFYDKDRKEGASGLITTAKTYNTSADSVLAVAGASTSRNDEPMPTVEASEQDTIDDNEEKEKKKKKKKKKKREEEADKEDTDSVLAVAGASTSKKDEPMPTVEASEQDTINDNGEKEKEKKKKKKKKKREEEADEEDTDSVLTVAGASTSKNDEPMPTVEASEQDTINDNEEKEKEKEKEKKKKKKKKKREEEADKEDTVVADDATEHVTEDTGKKEKKKKKRQLDENAELQSGSENVEAEGKKKKKRKHSEPDEVEAESSSKKREKKKRKTDA